MNRLYPLFFQGGIFLMAEENLPEVNVQVDEMAEYCAECHNAIRWNRSGN